MQLAAFERSDATLTKQLDVVLKQMNVERPAYHGKSFISNHVHICCKENNTRLCSAVVEKTEELCPSLLSEAREISVKFDQPLKLFDACHFVYDSADYLDDEKIYKMALSNKKLSYPLDIVIYLVDSAIHSLNNGELKCLCNLNVLSLILLFLFLEADIKMFLKCIREKFPDMTITAKLHMLEDHVCPFLRRWHMGLGFYGEQGIEGIHSKFNTQSLSTLIM
ncbi:uncharacterized protein [Montipora foliosa]|uniref:uncharacterized protein n=1 Tax=Montipora foliosa TaxID=591990 RepID=UPI0035F13AE2